MALVMGKTLENFRYVKKQHGEATDLLGQYWQNRLLGYAIGIAVLEMMGIYFRN